MSIKDLFGRQVLSDKNKKDLAYTAPPKNYEKNAYI